VAWTSFRTLGQPDLGAHPSGFDIHHPFLDGRSPISALYRVPNGRVVSSAEDGTDQRTMGVNFLMIRSAPESS
jgi:hypothetical protein